MPQNSLSGLDRRDGRVYHLPDGLRLAVQVAQVTGRPLLLRGEPGSGKSSLAPFLARDLKLRYYEQVVTSRTEANDLLWSFDHVRRLADAQIKALKDDNHYLRPGVLWWAFDSESAEAVPGARPQIRFDATEPGTEGAVVLIDEIDKAEPDVPNGLLVALGSQEFPVPGREDVVKRASSDSPVLIVITTNEERELSPAFLRRCVIFELPAPDADFLRGVAFRHLSPDGTLGSASLSDEVATLIDQVAEELLEARDKEPVPGYRPSTAEFLDTLKACLEMNIAPQDERWAAVRNLTLAKRQRPGR
ncbi:AAA family ATPase [Streptomyces erythrochromogenes]|uniref:AAA family ATPase n=1 Tax=Streptomyces erythrochromogenes TaxID=285574 RepID=UPI0036B81F8E